MTLSWEPGAGVARYRLEWGIGRSRSWTEVEEEIAGTSHTVTDLACGKNNYRFRLTARGDGTTYRRAWSDPVEITGVSTGACTTAPGRMSAPTLEADGDGLIVAWAAPSDDGGAPVTRYQVRYGRVDEPGQDPARWNRVSVTAPATSTTITVQRAGTTYAVQVRAKNRAGWSPWSESGTGATAAPAPPAPPTVGVSAQALFVGQSVTLTATATSTVTWQWQEWVSGKWTDVAGATSARHTAKSTTALVRAFRVVASYRGGATAESAPVVVGWRPLTVVVTASDDSPATGTPVILTATADAPDGVTYQWQKWVGGKWTDLGKASTQQVRETTRGTRKYRVVVSYTPADGTAKTAESPTVHVTWDEWAILADMLTELSAAVATSTRYTKAEKALLTCVNRNATSTFASFDDILSGYTGATRIKMESGDACASKATTMFSTNQDVTRSELAVLKNASSTYAALLESNRWRGFDAYIADAAELRATAILAGTDLSPRMSPSGGLIGQVGDDGAHLGIGLNCLDDDEDLTLEYKLEVLNCLIFDTPHSFWVKGGGTRVADSLETDPRYKDWLGFDDWRCTFEIESLESAAQGPVPSCLKHDVAYGTLWRLAGKTASKTELDETWNPRNKALADAKFKADISKYGCQDESTAARRAVCKVIPRRDWLADLYFWGTADYLNSDLGWPVTTSDTSHANSLQQFINCDTPVPSIVPDPLTKNGNSVDVTWTYSSGCASGNTVDKYRMCWEILTPNELGMDIASGTCRNVGGNSTSATAPFPLYLTEDWTKVILRTMAIKPNDIIMNRIGTLSANTAKIAIQELLVSQIPLSDGFSDNLNDYLDMLEPITSLEYYPVETLNLEIKNATK